MSNILEHLYEIIFFLVFTVPLVMRILPSLFSTLERKSQSRKVIAQSILDEIKLLELKRSNLTVLLESERSIRSGMPHYLFAFESSIKEEITQRTDLVLKDSTHKLDLERENTKKLAEIAIFTESFAQFRNTFAVTQKNHPKLDVLLKKLFQEIEKRKAQL